MSGLEYRYSKHGVAEVVVSWLAKWLGRPLRTADLTYGRGAGASVYRRYGPVVAYERDRDLLRRGLRDPDVLSVDLVSPAHPSFAVENPTSRYMVFMDYSPTDSASAIYDLVERGFSFDVVDIDPFGSSRPWFPQVFRLLSHDSCSVLFVTIGDMHDRSGIRLSGDGLSMTRYSRFGYLSAWNLDFDSILIKDRGTYTELKSLTAKLVGPVIMEMGRSERILSIPVFVFDDYRSRAEEERPALSGIQRLCFVCREMKNAREFVRLKQLVCTWDDSVGKRILETERVEGATGRLPTEYDDGDAEVLEVDRAIERRLMYMNRRFDLK